MNESLTRLFSGVVYVVLLLSATTYSVNSFFILFGFFMLVAVFEFCHLVHINYIVPLILAALGYYLSTIYNFPGWLILSLLAFTLFVSIKGIVLLFSSKTEIIHPISKYVYTLGYIILPFIIIARIPFSGEGFKPKIIISIFILIWTNDTFAYIIGKSIGKHKLLEKISPKKTIEGFIGGILFSLLAGFLISKYYFHPKPTYASTSQVIWTISAVIISIFSTIGDLIESKFKRLAEVKDSGKIMPGHGGILDRLDSIIFVAPFVYLFYQILNYVS